MGAGLTASVIRDTWARELYIEGGAMVLADGGVVCIDEFDKMRPEDRVAIHEGMEQQTISIAKAGISTVLNSRVAVLAAANPPTGRYDDLRSAEENIDMQTTILSRFDMIFLIKDKSNIEYDKKIARHVCSVHRTANLTSVDKNEIAENDELFFKKYIHFARNRCEPCMAKKAEHLLIDQYVKYRSLRRRIEVKSEDKNIEKFSTMPITVRKLESLIRISEALTRMT